MAALAEFVLQRVEAVRAAARPDDLGSGLVKAPAQRRAETRGRPRDEDCQGFRIEHGNHGATPALRGRTTEHPRLALTLGGGCPHATAPCPPCKHRLRLGRSMA